MNYVSLISYLNLELVDRALTKMNGEIEDNYSIEVSMHELDKATIWVYMPDNVEFAEINLVPLNNVDDVKRNTEMLITILGNIFQAITKGRQQ